MATATTRTKARQPAADAHGRCSLRLGIDGTTYRVRPIAAAPELARRAFRLTKPDGTAYDVAETPHGLQCDCPDFEFRHAGTGTACKHLAACVAVGLLSRPGPPPRRHVPDEFDTP